jgi:hypothetical protein
LDNLPEIRADTGEDFAAPRAREKLPGSTEHERANSAQGWAHGIAPPRSTSLVPPIGAGIAAVPKASGVCHKPTNAAHQAVCIGPDDSLNYIVGKLGAMRGAPWDLSQAPEKIAVLELKAAVPRNEYLLRREVVCPRLGGEPCLS